jgi:hypothetical protein
MQREQFRAVTDALSRAGYSGYQEPEDIDFNQTWSARIGGYSSLHYLRRVAAHIWAGQDPPEPIDRPTEDPLLHELYSIGPAGSPSRKFPGNTFAHLVHHSDAEGYYVPIDFPSPLVSSNVIGKAIGSSVRLLRECEQLAETIALPMDLDPESEEFERQLVSPSPNAPLWRRRPVESYVCLQLIAGCKASIRTGAALVLC